LPVGKYALKRKKGQLQLISEITDKNVIITVGPILDLAALAADWQKLEKLSPHSFFNSWSWIGTWLELLPRTVSHWLVRATQSGSVVGLAIICASDKRYRGIIKSHCLNLNACGRSDCDCMTIEYNDILGGSPIINDSFVRYFGQYLKEADELYLPGGRTRPSPDIVDELNLLTDVIEVPCYRVNLQRFADVGGDLMPLLSRNTRQQLRRSIRYWQQQGNVRVQEAESLQEAHSFFSRFKQLHISRWEQQRKPHAFHHMLFERFHRSLIDRCFGKGEIELLRISAGDVELGILYNFRYGQCTYAYQSGFCGDVAGRPGYVSHYYAIKYAHSRGSIAYDFLAGRNQLKESLSTDQGKLYWVRLQRPLFRFRLLHAARNVCNIGSILGRSTR